MPPDPKGNARVKDTDLMRLLHISADECEVTGKTGRLHLHHVLYRSQGGDDVRANLWMVDEDLHLAYHHGDPEARRVMAAHVEKRPDTRFYLREKLGQDAFNIWLGRHL